MSPLSGVLQMNDMEILENKILRTGWDIVGDLRCSGTAKKNDMDLLLEYLEEYKALNEENLYMLKRSTAVLFSIYTQLETQFYYIDPQPKSDLGDFRISVNVLTDEIFGGKKYFRQIANSDVTFKDGKE